MVSSEVKRTLVKSPPELWAELSDAAALARHLGDLGGDVENMRITRVHAEERVDWEADRISGTVLMKASGWGTKVTLRVSREFDQPIEPEPEHEPESPADATPAETSLVEETPSIEELLAATSVEPRRGFLSRLFRRRRPVVLSEPAANSEPTIAHEDPIELDTSASVPELEPPTNLAPVAMEPPPEAIPDVSADLKAAEEVAVEEVTAVLTATLDRLGAAHHRPFSRS